MGVKFPGRETDLSPPCSADVKNAWSYTSTPPIRIHGVVRVPVEAGNSSPHHRFQTGSGSHPASYPMGTRGSYPGDKAAGA
jgi:hypothetical protein